MSEPLFALPDDRPIMSRYTEREVLDVLRVRYSETGQGGDRYVRAEHVRSAAGFDALRVADLIVQDLYVSKGLHLIGHEVKVSRSDWLSELADPSKADEFRRYMNRWYLVAPTGVCRGDLPEGWGLIEVRDGKAKVAHRAPLLNPEPVPASMLAALLRSAVKTARRDGT